ncbi:glycosyltransferase [Iningainema tapete]|uniref:Glycosyl transferase n=1 Tax=Iningainema tapete BLCC-T55 TaxID=2748662 RepID=A0A8J6XQE8_9CYAN|nr:glycosyltransferase [Iningainema tapete]MBD2777356.1 glycosyl transferase [Iningainema tapete BLCC-T55]
MNKQERVKVFIGSGEASLIERKVLIYSLRKNSQREIDVYVFNGTHNSVELNDEKPFLAPMSLRVKYRNVTEFSFYRFLIPEICNHQGKAIWLDSDMIALDDIGELFDTPMNGCDLLANKVVYPDIPSHRDPRCLAVTVFDCEKVKFDLESLLDEVDQNHYSDRDLIHLTTNFRSFHPYKIGEFEQNWNIRDYWDKDTKLIHYTNLTTQPWKYPNHPYGELWFQYFNEALSSGYITQKDINLSMVRAAVRLDLLKGNFSFMGREFNYARSAIKKLKTFSAVNN